MTTLEEAIDQKIGEVRTDTLDLSYGELSNLYTDKELVIQPEYQRLFRWTPEQRSRIIESILLELPIPQIFVIENENGVIELIDGLQRVSSVLQFVSPEVLQLEPLRLVGLRPGGSTFSVVIVLSSSKCANLVAMGHLYSQIKQP